MKRTWIFCAAIVAVIVTCFYNALAINEYPGGGDCVWGSWMGIPDYTPSLVVFPYSLGGEPLTAGEPVSLSVSATVRSGLMHRYASSGNCDAQEEYGLWDGHVVDPIHWQASSASPSSGDVYVGGDGLYTVNLTPSGSGTITFTVHGITSTAGYPSWDETKDFEVPLRVLPPMRLGHWRFNDSNWIGEEGQIPSTKLNLENVTDWNYGALKMDPPNPANHPLLQYPAYQADGTPNVTRRAGAVRFWYKPSWSSTTPPATTVTLFQMQTDWSLDVSPSVNNGYVNVTLLAGGAARFTYQMSWTAGTWYQFVVVYSSAATGLYINGGLVASGSGVSSFSGALSSFTIGNNGAGNQPATGIYDELETFNYPLGYDEIYNNYQVASSLDSDQDGLTNLVEVGNNPATNPYNPDTDGDGVNDFNDARPTDPNRWDPDNPSDTTAPVIQMLEPITIVPFP